MSGGGKGGSNQQIAYYYVPVAFAICEGPIIGIKQIWAGGNLIYSDTQPVAVNNYQGGGKKSGPTVSTSYEQFSSSTQNDIQTGGSSLGPWTCYLGTETQPADPTIGEGVAYRGVAYIVFNPLNIGPGATIPPLTFEVVTAGGLNAPSVVWQTPLADDQYNYQGVAIDGNGDIVLSQANVQYDVFSAENGNQINSVLRTTDYPSYNYIFLSGLTTENGITFAFIGGHYATQDGGVVAEYGLAILNTDSFTYRLITDPSYGFQTIVYPTKPIAYDGTFVWGVASAGALPGAPNYLTIVELSNGEAQYFNAPSLYDPQAMVALNGYMYAAFNASLAIVDADGNISTYPIQASGLYISNEQVYCVYYNPNILCFQVGILSSDGSISLVATLTSMGLDENPGLVIFDNAIWTATGSITKFSMSGDVLWNYLTGLSSNISGNFLEKNGYIYQARASSLIKINPGANTIITADTTLPEAVTTLCERAGLTQFDVSLLPAIAVNFVRGDTVTARSMLQRLSQAYFFSMVDSGGTLRFVPQGQPSQAVIPLEDLGYGKVSVNAQTPFTSSRISGVDLPRSVKIRYTSAALNWEKYEQIFALESYESGKEITLDLPLILDDQTAYNIAALACTLPHAEREQYSFTTSYKWLALEPGDVVTLPFGTCRILTVKMGQKNGIPVIDFTACIDGMNALAGAGYAKPGLPNYQPNTGGLTALLAAPSSLAAVHTPSSPSPHPIATAPQVNQTVPNAGTAKLVLTEPPPLKSTDTGMRFYAGAYSTGNVFPGAGIFESSDGGDTYTQMVTEISATSAGYANTVLGPPNATQGFYTWDTQNTVDIYMLGNGSDPAPMTDLQVMNGANGAMLGQELIQFAQATLMTDSFGNAFYRLSRLLRGRRGTQWAMGTHAIGESFYPIPAGLTKESYTPPMLNNAYLYKIVMAGGDLSNAPAVSYEPNGNSLLQWSVCHPLVSVDSSGDWTVTWTPRARYNGDWASGYIPTLDPDTAGWSIDVLSGTTVKRTINVPLQTTAPWQTIYTAAMQSADGFTPGQSGIIFNIYQLSSQIGRGTVRSITTP